MKLPEIYDSRTLLLRTFLSGGMENFYARKVYRSRGKLDEVLYYYVTPKGAYVLFDIIKKKVQMSFGETEQFVVRECLLLPNATLKPIKTRVAFRTRKQCRDWLERQAGG